VGIKEPIFFRRDDVLSHEQALYWKDLLYRTVKIGTELEFALPKGVHKKSYMPELVEAMQPTKDLSELGQYGVLDVIDEHCGVEIQIIGRQPYYTALLQQYQAIFDLLPRGIRARPTCGLHYHVLTVGLSEPVPEIILANVWNLTRRYAPNLKFITSAGDQLAALCRRRNYNSHLEMVRHTPGTLTMLEIQAALRESKRVPEHNNFLNLEHIAFTEDGAVKPFHYENRFPDADLSPVSIVAKTFLFLAILLKAVEISQYGVIHVGRIKKWRRQCQLLDWLSNNDGRLATSDTSKIKPEVIEELRVGGRELLELLKPVFDRWEHNPSFEVLSFLAETPISLLRASGRSWEEINTLLADRAAADQAGLDKTDRRLMRAVELGEFGGSSAQEIWQWQVARELYLTPQELEERLERLDKLRGLRWDQRLGTMVFRL